MKRLQLLDYGRFAAAFSVLLYHYTFNGFRNGKISSIGPVDFITYVTHFGKIGVEFFFIISGYVIYYSAQNKTPGEFAFSRIKRLYPAFWFAVFFYFTVCISYFIHIIIEKRLSGFWTVLFKNCIERPVSFLEQKLLPAKNTSIGK